MGSPAHTGRTLQCPVLIGRGDLVALAGKRLAAAESGSGGLLLLAGEAGIGKTRLLAEICHLARTADRQAFRVVEVGAYPRDLEISGGVLSDLAAALRRRPDMAASGEAMAARLSSLGSQGGPDGHGGEGEGDASRQRRLLVADLAELIVTIGTLGTCDGPVLLAVEDLHWADDLTLEVFDRVVRRLAATPLLVVGTYRSDELYPRVPMRAWRTRLLTQRLAEEVTLDRLDRDETAAMAAAIADTALPTAVTASVHERSDGIPLHVEEFLAFVSAPRASRRGVPETLADAVLERAQALSATTRKLADAASVIGRSFDIDLLTAVAGDTPQAVDEALRELQDRFFVRQRGDTTAYDFRHALIGDALYTDLSPHRRRELHFRAAAAAAAAGFGDAFVSDQYERAAQPALAYRHARSAAAEAAAISAHREAVQLYERARRTMPAETAPREQADLLAALAAELAATDDNSAAASVFFQAYEMLRRLGDDVAAASLMPALASARHLLGADIDERDALLKEALALVDSASTSTGGSIDRTRARILAALSAAYMLDRCLDDSIAIGTQAQELASGMGDVATSLNTDSTLGSALVFAGRMGEGWQMLERTAQQAQDAHLEAEAARGYRMIGSCASVLVEYERGLRWLREGISYAERVERFNDRHYMAAHLAHTLWATGQWQAAAAEAQRALADGRGGVTTRITALHVLGYLAVGRGDFPAAEEHLHEARRLGEGMAELQRLSPALWGLAEAALLSGRHEDAVMWCEKGYAASSPAWDAAYLFPYVVTGIRAYLALDNLTAAGDWLERCTKFVLYRMIPGTLPALDHARGLLHLARGHTGRAREALATAGQGWDSRSRFWEGTQALLDRAAAAKRSRRPAEAATLSAEAHRRAGAVGAIALLPKTTGRAKNSHSANGSADEPPLTSREIEVARLIATGATNRQIAQALFISPKTVNAHVEHILTKLGAARRTEIAAWAVAHPR